MAIVCPGLSPDTRTRAPAIKGKVMPSKMVCGRINSAALHHLKACTRAMESGDCDSAGITWL